MKSLFASLVLVGVASCTITTDRTRSDENPIEYTRTTNPFIEKDKYREGVLSREIREEEGILGRSTHGGVGTGTSRSHHEKLLKHKLPRERIVERGHKKHHLKEGNVLLTRGDKKYRESVEDKDIFSDEEELFSVADREDVPIHKGREVEVKLRKKANPLLTSKDEVVGILEKDTHKRGILNP